MLRSRHPSTPEFEQILVRKTLRPRLLHLAHNYEMDEHRGRTRFFNHVPRTYYWPLMAAETESTVRSCTHCARNRFRLICRKQPMRLFPATAYWSLSWSICWVHCPKKCRKPLHHRDGRPFHLTDTGRPTEGCIQYRHC